MLVLLILGGVFTPTLSWQVLNSTLLAGAVVVLVVWLAWGVTRSMPRGLPRWLQLRRKPLPQPPEETPQTGESDRPADREGGPDHV